MSLGYPSVRVSIWTRQKHWRLDDYEKRAPIPQLIWSDCHVEWSRWYWIKENDVPGGRVANPYIHFKS
jgi:hypothetical protein